MPIDKYIPKQGMLFVLITLLGLPFAMLGQQSGEWYHQNPKPCSSDFNDLAVFDSNRMLVLGEGGLFKTFDGGDSWNKVAVSSSPDQAIDFPDGRTGWIVGPDGAIFKSENYGNTWRKQSFSTLEDLFAVHFLNADTGFAGGSGDLILRTTDGGKNWNKAPNVPTNNGTIRDLHFIGVDTGWASGGTNSGESFILYTTDGGKNWQKQFTATGGFKAIDFVNSDSGWVVGQAGEIYVTSDGGNSWNKQQSNTGKTLRSVNFKNGSKGWIAGDDGVLLLTTDGGNNWQSKSLGVNKDFNALGFHQNRYRWLVGDDGLLYKSIDGGNNWQSKKQALVVSDLKDLYFVNSDTGWAVGLNETILHTDNGGQKWKIQRSGGQKDLHDVEFVSADTGWAVGGENQGANVILYTNDGGKSWNTQFTGQNETLFGLDFPSSNHGYAVGETGTIVYTDDGGDNWQAIKPGTLNFNDVYFTSKDTGWAVGDAGNIYYTDNGGGFWEDRSRATSNSFYALAFTSSDTGWIAGDQELLYTTDQGQSWNNKGPSQFTINDIFFTDKRNGWLITDLGILLKTSDGGTNWIPAGSSCSNCNQIFLTNTETGWIVGDNGLIKHRNCISTNVINRTSCESYSLGPNNKTWTSSGVYKDTLTNDNNCDSIVTIDLTINQKSFDTIEPTACNNYTSPSGNSSWTSSGIYKDTLTNSDKCDSILTIDLTIRKYLKDTLKSSACDNYVSPSGKYTWDSSGIYMDTIAKPNTCDSVYTIDLTIRKYLKDTLRPSACDNYVSPSGKYTWDSSGIYMDTITNPNNCDSVFILELTLNTVDSSVNNFEDSLIASEKNATYQWLDCNNNFSPISGETDSIFTPSTDGRYALKVKKANCTDTSQCFSIEKAGISQSLKNEEIRIYPNPTKSAVTIEIKASIDAHTYELKNLSGKTLQTGSLNQGSKKQLNLDEVSDGVYILKVKARKTLFIKRLVVR